MIAPVRFDANEWFTIVSILVVTAVMVLLPRRFPVIVSAVFFALGGGIAMYVDFHLGIPPVDLYDINDSSQYEWFDLLIFVLYCPFSYFFAYFLDRWRLRGLTITLYVLGWAAAAVSYEAFAAYLHVYDFQKGWNSGYSFVFYLTSQAVTVWFYGMIKRHYNRTKSPSGPEWA